MALYESVFIIRPDVSEGNLMSIMSRFLEKVEIAGGKMLKSEYLGKKRLSHKVKKNENGHYLVLWIEIDTVAMNSLKNEKLSEDIIRTLILKAEKMPEEEKEDEEMASE